jgi:trehalose-phosphatase
MTSATADITAAVDAFVGTRGRLLIVADFDGTLSPGSRDPGAARIEPAAQRALRRLAAIGITRPDRLHVAILTGRTVRDVAARARVGGISYLGDHGLQTGSLARRGRATGIVVATEPGFDAQASHAETLASGVAASLGRPAWLFVERKGPSVAFHVRQADDIPAARTAVLQAIASVERDAALGDHGLVPYRGRSVVDMRPVGAGGKREATERLIARHVPAAVISLGDDLSDAEAFDAVHDARRRGRITYGLTVAVHGRVVAPPEVLERADVVVASSRDVGRLLDAVARRLSTER